MQLLMELLHVSIHAPVRVRPDAGSDDSTPAGFNPRTRVGATEEGEQEAGKDLGFNPRTREGATRQDKRSPVRAMVSIHAPVRVRRADDAGDGRCCLVSIHAPVRVRH